MRYEYLSADDKITNADLANVEVYGSDDLVAKLFGISHDHIYRGKADGLIKRKGL
jgi:hypothetical protein